MYHIYIYNLNYSSFALKVLNPHIIRGTFKRSVTNIGSPSRVFMSVPNGLNISVKPGVLSFASIGEKKILFLTIDGLVKESIRYVPLIWYAGEYQVRNQIIVYDKRAEKMEKLCILMFGMLSLLLLLICLEIELIKWDCVPILRKIKQFMDVHEVVIVSHLYRDTNRCTYMLANHECMRNVSSIFEETLGFLMSLLDAHALVCFVVFFSFGLTPFLQLKIWYTTI